MQYLIDFLNSAAQAEIDQYLIDNGCAVLKQWNNFDKIYLVESNTEPSKTSIVERVVLESAVAIKPHVLVDSKFGCHNNPSYPSISVNTTDKKDWWKNFCYVQPKFDSDTLTLSRLGESIKVYVMDSGIDDTHPEFADANITKLYSVTPNDFNDTAGHGTALASIIVGKTCGITNAKLKVVKIFDKNHDTLQSEFLDALDAILADHEDNTFAVLNASWSIPKNEWVEHKLSLCVQEGIFVLAAAGNTGVSIENVTPASMWESLTIGAYNSDLQPCDFSNYTGPAATGQGTVNEGELDGWAPGEEIWCAGLGGGYGFMSGTSMATAICSAVLASNLEWMTTNNDQREFYVQNLIVSTIANQLAHNNSILFGRYDLLELNDPKYANSINRIATLIDRCITGKPQPADEISSLVRVGEIADTLIYSTQLTKSVEFLDPIPNNFQISNLGRLHCRPTEENAPVGDDHYRLYAIRFNRTDLYDQTELVTVNIYVVNADKNLEEIPEDDQVIPITLLASCLAGGGGCKSGATFGCIDSCYPTYIGCCAGVKDTAFSCKCDPG